MFATLFALVHDASLAISVIARLADAETVETHSLLAILALTRAGVACEIATQVARVKICDPVNVAVVPVARGPNQRHPSKSHDDFDKVRLVKHRLGHFRVGVYFNIFWVPGT